MVMLRDIVVDGEVVGKEAYYEEEQRKGVVYPAQRPDGCVPGEAFDLKEMRSKKFAYDVLGDSLGRHYGPYIALWRGFSYDFSENEWVISCHDEDSHKFEVLFRSFSKREASKTFEGLKEEYPETYLHSKWGGARDGAGKPASLSDPVTLTIRVDRALAERIKQRSVKEGRSYADFLREKITKSIEE